jgi:hypothetical protein
MLRPPATRALTTPHSRPVSQKKGLRKPKAK